MSGESYLGRGYEPIAGKPFGWAWNMERREIREHLKARGRWRDARDEFVVERIQRRLNREHPRRWAARIAAWKARQPKATSANLSFSIEELERLVELFGSANDPITAAIGAKAVAALERLTT